mmetsp:Transcript_36142/g.84694  ORF Transcript_36142/g.84694 Transcript_36142/m.84694 type:complete len:281 (+) Transcript_36142:49-891(+)
MAIELAVRQVVQHKDFAVKFKHPIRFDGTNYVETRLGVEEQQAEVSKLAGKSPHVFLERYGDLLSQEEMLALKQSFAQTSPEVQYWLDKYLQKPPSEAERSKLARRRRWNWAKLEMAKGEGFFSEQEMKRREPKLFMELVGRHLEPASQMTAPEKGGLSTYLLQQMDREEFERSLEPPGPVRGEDEEGCRPAKTRRRNDEDEIGGVVGNDEDVDMLLSDTEGDGGQVDIAERRAQFLKAMRNKFIDGRERDFDYNHVDVDSDLDDLAELNRDAEEKYFDD